MSLRFFVPTAAFAATFTAALVAGGQPAGTRPPSASYPAADAEPPPAPTQAPESRDAAPAAPADDASQGDDGAPRGATTGSGWTGDDAPRQVAPGTAASADAPATGCTTDIQCKADRICQAGVCTWPRRSAPAAATPRAEATDDVDELVVAPQKMARHALYVEGGGAGIAYSVNYEYRASEDLALRIGIGGFTYDNYDYSPSFVDENGVIVNANEGLNGERAFVAVPVSLHLLRIGNRRHKFEIAGGATLIYDAGTGWGPLDNQGIANEVTAMAHGFLGYRMHFYERGFLLRAGLTPLIGSFGFLPSGGLSLGASFQ